MPQRGIRLSARECALLLCLGVPPLLNLGCKVNCETRWSEWYWIFGENLLWLMSKKSIVMKWLVLYIYVLKANATHAQDSPLTMSQKLVRLAAMGETYDLVFLFLVKLVFTLKTKLYRHGHTFMIIFWTLALPQVGGHGWQRVNG